MIAADLRLARPGFTLQAEFTAPAVGVTGIFGPSGCGKTTLLRALAGLEPGVQGRIHIGSARWLEGGVSLPVAQRRVGFVFQEPSLFPHLTVLENLEFARIRSKKTSYSIDFEHVCELLEITQLLPRRAPALSGGERQRVAIGRALLGHPAVLLLDEPLSALDQKARQHLIQILEKVFQEIEIPVFYVSHASDEIARLAEHLVLMDRGRVVACGELRQVLGAVDSPLSNSDESFSVIRCRVEASQLAYLTTLRTVGGAVIQIPQVSLGAQSEIRLRIRARDVSLALEEATSSSILNILPVRVTGLAPEIEQGSRTVKLDLAGETLLARISEYSVQALALVPGKTLFAQIKSVSLLV